MKKRFFVLLVLFMAFAVVLLDPSEVENIETEKVSDFNSTTKPVSKNATERGNLEVFFCPEDECASIFVEEVNSSKQSVFCAFYNLEHAALINLLESKTETVEVKLVMEAENRVHSDLDINTDYYRDEEGYDDLMHHKFCVIDNKTVITGSTNPTYNGFYRNNNNLLVINSETLADNYINEFEQLHEGRFGDEKEVSTEYRCVEIKEENSSFTVTSYFCPQEDCGEAVVRELRKADKSILFASFVFTNDKFTSVLKEKAGSLEVKGVVEEDAINFKGSDYDILKSFVKVDSNEDTMHHKFFVIDNKTVITGSMNPTASGVKYNDENILVIENRELANKYLKEFYSLYG